MFKKTALLSVYHKARIVEFAQELISLGWKLIASGGTCTHLQNAGLEVMNVADLVGGGAILGHRVVTLSREVHAGLLARPISEDEAELEQLGIPWIDLVCVDLYPLEAEIARAGATVESVIEQTDIGGPTMVRSAAKGGRIVICDPADRDSVLKKLREDGDLNSEERRKLAAKAEFTIAKYCLASARYLSQDKYDGFIGELTAECQYGENPLQAPAALYTTVPLDPLGVGRFTMAIEGDAPSYNNLADLDRLLQTITHIAATFDFNKRSVKAIAVAVKHGNACGAAVGDDPIGVLEKTVVGHPRAIFGGLVMTNFLIGESEAKTLLTHGMTDGRRILDGIIAPWFDPKATLLLRRKTGKCRMLKNPLLANIDRGLLSSGLDIFPRFRYVRGGFLMQPNYRFIFGLALRDLEILGNLNDQQKDDFLLAWAICATSNSNTITIAKNGMLIGNGVGQQDRVGAAELAIKRARESGHDLQDSVAASDSFFSFPDGPQRLIEAGVKVIFATTGSKNDDLVTEAIRKGGVTFVRLPDAIGRGFFGH